MSREARVWEARLDYPKGHPEAPLSNAEIEAKAETYLGKLVDGKITSSTINRFWSVEKENGLDWMLAPLQKAVG